MALFFWYFTENRGLCPQFQVTILIKEEPISGGGKPPPYALTSVISSFCPQPSVKALFFFYSFLFLLFTFFTLFFFTLFFFTLFYSFLFCLFLLLDIILFLLYNVRVYFVIWEVLVWMKPN